MEKVEKGELINSGKAKSLYKSSDPDFYIMHYRDDTSAFDGVKKESLEGKGKTNNKFNAFIMLILEKEGVATHFQKLLSDTESLVKKLDMVPVECVIRNVAAGGICRRLGLEEGLDLDPPTFEFFYKNDELHDPMINEMKIKTFQVNDTLKRLFSEAGMILVDFKLEFGSFKGELLLGDEFTPDGCRVWDSETREKLDKDRFRQDLGNVVESYQTIAKKLGIN